MKFEDKDTISDTRHNSGIGRPWGVRTDAIEILITETSQKSVRRTLHEQDGNINKSSVHRILKFNLKPIPYMISVMHDLKETEVVKNLPVGFQVDQTLKIQQIAYGFSMKPTSISIMM